MLLAGLGYQLQLPRYSSDSSLPEGRHKGDRCVHIGVSPSQGGKITQVSFKRWSENGVEPAVKVPPKIVIVLAGDPA